MNVLMVKKPEHSIHFINFVFVLYLLRFAVMSDGVTPLKWSLEGDFISHNATARGGYCWFEKTSVLADTLNMIKMSFLPFCTSKTGVLLNIDVNEIY